MKPTLKRYGTQYGGKFVDIDKINNSSIVYSFGLGDDITFDLELIKNFGCTIYGFDPTPRSMKYILNADLPAEFNFLPVGLDGANKLLTFRKPPCDDYMSYTPDKMHTDLTALVLDLSTTMKLFNHTHVDVLKMDIEGSEYNVIENLLENKIYPDQILVEFHDPNLDSKYISMLQEEYNLANVDDREFVFIKN